MQPSTCDDEEGCDRPAEKRDKCNKHYLRYIRKTPKAERSAPPRSTTTDIERFFSFVNKMGPIAKNWPELGRCWIWTGGKVRGYGYFWAQGKTHRAHIWSYTTFVKPVPDGLELDHFACDREDCVNYEHVRPATQLVNTLRSTNPMAENARKEDCDYGHPFNEENTRINAKGARECKICKRQAQREMKQAQRAVQRGYAPLPAGTETCPAGHELVHGTVHRFEDGTLVCLVCNAPRAGWGRPRKE
jgi:hypothetical protein